MRRQLDRHAPWWFISSCTVPACRGTWPAGSTTEKPDGDGVEETATVVVYA